MTISQELQETLLKRSVGIRQAERATSLARTEEQARLNRRLVRMSQDAWAMRAGVTPPAEVEEEMHVHVGDVIMSTLSTPDPASPPTVNSSATSPVPATAAAKSFASRWGPWIATGALAAGGAGLGTALPVWLSRPAASPPAVEPAPEVISPAKQPNVVPSLYDIRPTPGN